MPKKCFSIFATHRFVTYIVWKNDVRLSLKSTQTKRIRTYGITSKEIINVIEF